jgi:hypothetical protein
LQGPISFIAGSQTGFEATVFYSEDSSQDWGGCKQQPKSSWLSDTHKVLYLTSQLGHPRGQHPNWPNAFSPTSASPHATCGMRGMGFTWWSMEGFVAVVRLRFVASVLHIWAKGGGGGWWWSHGMVRLIAMFKMEFLIKKAWGLYFTLNTGVPVWCL